MARIIIYIIFHIINAIAMQEEEKTVPDEREKLIKLKALRNAHHVFFAGIMLSITALAIGMPVYGIFLAFVIFSVIYELVDNGSQICYNRKGV